jgi:hypothetical protein
MMYYRILLFCALHIVLYNAHQLLPASVDAELRFRFFDTCKTLIILTAPILIACKPSIIGAATLFVHFAFVFYDAINTAINGDVGNPSGELIIYFFAIAVLFLLRVWVGDMPLTEKREWKKRLGRKFARLFKRS